jgi:hypothetical protein
VRAACILGPAIAIAACSGATTSPITQSPGDAGSSTDGSHGGADGASGDDASVIGGDDAQGGSDAIVLHEAGQACHPSPSPDGGACNPLIPPPASIVIQCNQTELVPAPTGGTIADGHYVMTSSTYYAGGGACPTPENDGVTWLICGSQWEIAQTTAINGQPPSTLVANATVVPASPNVAITLTCGITTAPITFGYDATPTTLRLHINGTAPNGRIDVFTRQ